jgi:hypothetical protein
MVQNEFIENNGSVAILTQVIASLHLFNVTLKQMSAEMQFCPYNMKVIM